MEDKPFVWHCSDNFGRPMADFGDVGCWVYFALKQELPRYPEGTKHNLDRPTLHGKRFQEAVHCTSMYNLMNIVINGLKADSRPARRGLSGMFCYRTDCKVSNARSSSGYCSYESLCRCPHNIFFGPRMMVEVQAWRLQQLGRHAPCPGQWALPLSSYHLRGFYIHIVTPEDTRIFGFGNSPEFSWYFGGHWDPRYEIREGLIEV